MTTGLLVAGGGFQGLPMLRALRELGARVVVADSYAQNPNRYQADVYAVVPPVAQRASFDSAILDLCREHRVDIVFSTTAHDALAVAALAPQLRSTGIVVAVASHELLAAWTDKATCLSELAGAGLPVLPIVDPDREPRGLPLIGKPRRGFGSRDIVAARTAAELASALAADTAKRLFWQPLLESFTEWSIDFAVDEQGRVSRSSCGNACDRREDSPLSAGSGTRRASRRRRPPRRESSPGAEHAATSICRSWSTPMAPSGSTT